MNTISNPAFWVGLSTIIFLAIVILKSCKFIIEYFNTQRNNIKFKLSEAEAIYQKANSLYQEYQERMKDLDIETNKVLEDANNEAKKIIDGAESAVAKIIVKKEQELSQSIIEYEVQLKNKILLKYADAISDDLHITAKSNSDSLN